MISFSSSHFKLWQIFLLVSVASKYTDSICANVFPYVYHYISLHYFIYFDGSEHDCIDFIANALELLQSCTKQSI